MGPRRSPRRPTPGSHATISLVRLEAQHQVDPSKFGNICKTIDKFDKERTARAILLVFYPAPFPFRAAVP